MKKVLLLSFIALVIIAPFIFKYLTKPPKNSYRTTSVKKGKIIAITRARGEVIPLKTYKITSCVSGIIESVLKDEGDYVKKGELLLSIDKAEYLTKLKQAEKELLQLQNRFAELEDKREIKTCEKEIKEASLLYEDLKRQYETNLKLYELKAIPEEELLNKELELKKAKLSLELKKDELLGLKRKREDELNLLLYQEKEIKSNYNWIKKQINYTEIRSPTSGIIMEKNPDIIQGFSVQQGAHLFTIIPLLYQVKGFIDETDISKLDIKDKGIVRFDAYPYQPCIGIIKKISLKPFIPEGKGIRRFEVYLDINPPFKIFPNMQCSLEFKKVLHCLKVSIEDIEEKDGKRYVYLIKDKKKIKREIKTGFESETEVEVLEGLKEKDIIIKHD